MNILEIGGLAVIGLACGALVAAGMFTFITMLGIVTRLAQITKTARYILHYESWICAGAMLGNLLWMAVTMMEDFENWGMIQPVWTVCLFVFGGLAGAFTGCLIGAIAEILNAFPIMFRRIRFREGTAWVIAALAAGKFAGVLIQFLK